MVEASSTQELQARPAVNGTTGNTTTTSTGNIGPVIVSTSRDSRSEPSPSALPLSDLRKLPEVLLPTLPAIPTQETMRRVGWEIGERKPAALYVPESSHLALHWVAPKHGFAHWRIKPEWIDTIAKERGPAWNNCRMLLRLYDVSYIIFNGLNAHQIVNVTLPQICGHMFFHLPKPGTTQIAEVGFELRSGEFIPAARSLTTPFPPDSVSGRGSHAALLVGKNMQCESVENLWEQERILTELKRPKLRKPLRIGTFAFESAALGQSGTLATFVSELAKEQCAAGHDVHVFAPARENFSADRQVDGVIYHPVDVELSGSPVELAERFGRAVNLSVSALPAFDLFHVHEWIAGVAPWITTRPAVLSLASIETSRRNGAEPTALSEEIQKAERDVAQGFDVVLTPDYIRARAISDFGINADRIVAFPMEGRLPNEWEMPLDLGKVKQELGFGPLDRVLLFVGPLEHRAGPDMLVEALPTALQRALNLRIAFIGTGPLHDSLYHRANALGAGHAVRIFGHVDGSFFKRALRAAEAVVLPSRQRVPGDEAVINWARLAGRAMITTHAGPAHLVRHEHNGVITFDNPGSMIWAIDRVLGDPTHTERMGANGRQHASSGSLTCPWSDVARRYLDLCAASFPELT
jgi:glycosyltransferase involved in cell wall biosynthesis